VVDHIIRLAYQSVADLAMIPMQDVLDLGSAARMNTPAVPNGNWEWRFAWDDVRPERWAWLGALAHVYGRRPDP
jgi:4-alpha-glucanotransferase